MLNPGSSNLPVRIPRAGRRARNIAKSVLVFSLIFLTILGSIGTWLPGLSTFFGSMFPQSTTQNLGGCSTNPSNFTNITNPCAPPISDLAPTSPNSVGAGAAPKISVPRTIVSSVDSSLLAGGVSQASANNLTLYSSAITLRLLGGSIPHDEILSRSHRILSSYLFWGVEANISGVWTPL